MDFYYKGLGPEERIFAQTPEAAAAKAKGTLYEAWFDVLQTSPWYNKICESQEFPSGKSEETWKQFGDLRGKSFSKWWLEAGYKIFAEVVPYYSTAQVHQERETKLTYATIKKWMQVYQAYEKQKVKKDFKLYNFAKDQELHPTLFRGLLKRGEVPDQGDLRTQASNVASDILKKAMFLMANATEMSFPNTAPHEWVVTSNRAKKTKKE